MQHLQEHPEILERFDRLWKGADTDRPVLYVTFPRERPDPAVLRPQPAHPADRLRPDLMLARARWELARTDYLAEGFPRFFVNYGPGVLHACIGGELHVRDEATVWFPHFLDDLAKFPALAFDPQSRWWRTIMETTALLLEDLGDRMLVSYTDIGGPGDVLASSVGTEQLLMDIAERPELVGRCAEHAGRLWEQAFAANHALLAERQQLFTHWYPVLSRGPTYLTQCDLNAMLGPESFATLFAPGLARAWKMLADAVYHLDGVGTEAHVPALLAPGGLKLVQWTPPPGESALKWAAMLRGIQEAGRSVTFNVRQPEEVERACKLLDRRRLLLVANCASAAEARALVERARAACRA